MEADDTRRIVPTIAVVPHPPSRELFIQHSSRFKKNKETFRNDVKYETNIEDTLCANHMQCNKGIC